MSYDTVRTTVPTLGMMPTYPSNTTGRTSSTTGGHVATATAAAALAAQPQQQSSCPKSQHPKQIQPTRVQNQQPPAAAGAEAGIEGYARERGAECTAGTIG